MLCHLMYLNPWAQPSDHRPQYLKFSLYSALSECIRQLSLSTLSLVGFSEGLKTLLFKFIPSIQVQVFL